MSKLGNFSRRLFAGLLAILMVVGFLPIPGISVTYAETGAVTVTVKDENGDPVSEASVEYAIQNGETTVASDTKATDADGIISIDYNEYADGMVLTGSVTKSGYVTASINKTITSVSESVDVVLERPEITDITLTAKENLKYTGEDLALVETPSFQDGDTVVWKVANKETSSILSEYAGTGVPNQKDVATYTVSLTVNREGFKPFMKSVDVTIGKGTITDVSLAANTDLVYSGEKQELVSATGILASDTVAWSVNSAAYDLADGESVPNAFDAGEYRVGVSVSRDNYEDYTDEVTVTIDRAEITGVSLSPLNPTYTSEPQNLVSPVTGLAAGDTIAWKVNGNPVVVEADKVPVGTDAGNYTVTATVTRNDNYETKDLEVTATIATAQTGISISKRSEDLVYNSSEQALVDLTGTILATDTVVWKVNDEVVTLEDGQVVPTAKDAGEYTVSLHLERANYTTVDITVEGIEIEKSTISTGDLNATANTLTYNGTAQELVTVTGQGEGYTLEYKVGEADWTTDVPAETNAGEYVVSVRAVNGSNYYDKMILDAGTAVIAQAELAWTAKPENDEYTISGAVPYSEQYSFVAKKMSGESEITDAEVIQYSVDNTTIAEIDSSTGSLTVHYPGTITVTAAIPNTNDNFTEAFITTTITIIGVLDGSDDHFIVFGETPSEYVLGTNNGVISEAVASLVDEKITGDISYEMTEIAGVSIDANSGKVTVTDITAFEAAMAGNPIELTITANKASTEFYGEDSVSYTVNAVYAETPDEAYTLEGTLGNASENGAGWYLVTEGADPVTIIPKEGFTIAIDTPEDFAETQTISTEGTTTRAIYLKNAQNGITAPISVTVSIDTIAPSGLGISYSAPLAGTISETVSLGFYQSAVTVTFSASDATSGLDYVVWTYTRAEGQSTTNLENDGGTVQFQNDGTVSITLEGQYRGRIAFVAFDKAGNSSDGEEQGVFAVDSIRPSVDISFSETENYTEDVLYYSGDVTVTLTVTEANFYAEQVQTSVVDLLNGDAEAVASPTWADGANLDEHIGTFTLSGDGHYKVKVVYADTSTNAMEAEDAYDIASESTYTSKEIVIDTAAPTFDIDFGEKVQKTDDGTEYYDADIEPTVTIVETNFFSEDVTIQVQKDGEDPVAATVAWSDDGDTHTGTFAIEGDGYYTVTASYTDRSNWKMVGVENGATVSDGTYSSDTLVIDTVAPTDIVISYSDPIKNTASETESKWWEHIIEMISFGFYNPSQNDGNDGYVKVTFTAKDETAGVQSFIWSFAWSETDTMSDILTEYPAYDPIEQNQGLLRPGQIVNAEKDGDLYSANVLIPIPRDGEEFDQLRGTVTVTAIDFSKNYYAATDNERIIVSDTIAPEFIRFDYSAEVRGDDNTKLHYYQSTATIGVTIQEVNFFGDDVKAEVNFFGDDVKAAVPSPNSARIACEWTSENDDIHSGTYSISGLEDGDYTLNVSYTDRSLNEMKSITSETFVIDTVKPVITVSYRDTNFVENINGNRYYSDNAIAEVKIIEHNFKEDEVLFTINGTGYTTADGNKWFDGKVTADGWANNGDTHTLVVTFSGENNYTFDVAYADLAENAADDYQADITVDRTPPTNLTISYSQSVLDTVLNGVTFGFYQNKVNVTLTATDATAGIRRFTYSYTTAAGVSGVNSGLNGQTVDVSQMTQQGNTWTYTFSIPQAALDSNNQFNGTVSFTAVDCSGNSTSASDVKRVVVDNISPNGTLSFNTPSNVENDISYYSGNVNGTIEITEANFYSDDVSVTATKDGGESFSIPTTWTDQNVDSHTGTFTLTEDGDYVVTVSYRDKSGNGMATQTTKQMTIDHQIDPATITINSVEKSGNAGAYNGDIDLQFAFADTNLDTVTYTLTRTSASIKNEDVSSFVTVGDYDKEGTGSVSIPREVGNDGIYDLTVTVKDKAGNAETSHVRFAVCRFGSVYEYSDYLISLIREGSNYHKSADGAQPAITGDLVITEYNATDLADGSLKISITRDGELVDAKFDVNKVATEEPDWYQYVYTISKDNFTEDGVYSISLSSEYSATDSSNNTVFTSSISVPENSNVKDIMQFVVDTTAPDIRNITNLENRIINESEITVNYTIVDVGGLQKVEVVLNGQTIDTITDFGNDVSAYNGSFIITESTQEQTVQIIVTDIAGNITDTSSKDFNPGDRYVFNNAVTVSTNVFVRFYANKPLFWGSVGGVVALAGGAGTAVVIRRRKKETA